MDVSKFFTILCAFLFVICLTLAITTLVALHNTVRGIKEWQNKATVPVGNPDLLPTDDFVTVTSEPTDVDLSPSEIYYMKSVNGTVGVYSADGYLIRMLNVRLETLPTAEQKALKEGITATSWEEILNLIQDYD